MVQLDPFSEPRWPSATANSVNITFDLDGLESCNTTFDGLSRAASSFLTLGLHVQSTFTRHHLRHATRLVSVVNIICGQHGRVLHNRFYSMTTFSRASGAGGRSVILPILHSQLASLFWVPYRLAFRYLLVEPTVTQRIQALASQCSVRVFFFGPEIPPVRLFK